MNELKSLRKKIDALDKKLLELVAERLRLAREIVDIKLAMEKPLLDEEREREILETRKTEGLKLGLDPEFVENLMRVLMRGGLGEELKKAGEVKIWSRIEETFRGRSGELAVVRTLLNNGLRVTEKGEIKCGEIRVPALQVGKAAGVDRRTVNATVRRILKDDKLRRIFANLRPMPNLRDVGKEMGWGVLEIVPKDARQPGVLKQIVSAISDAGINIRQAIAEDPHLTSYPKLVVITDTLPPAEVIDKLRRLPTVYSVLVY